MINIAICDDEPLMCSDLKQLVSSKLAAMKNTCSITCYRNSAELLSSSLKFDLIFLDIGLPGMNGITAARLLREQGFHGSLIFVTVMPEFMPDAFEVEAIDYLCKPIDEARLEKALQRTLKHVGEQDNAALFIRTLNWCRSVPLREIYYCEVINRKIYLHTITGTIDYYARLKDLEPQLDHRFVKCHRSYLINLTYLKKYENGQVTLEDGSQIPVSRPHQQLLMDAMMHYLERRNNV